MTSVNLSNKNTGNFVILNYIMHLFLHYEL